jgi:hypothetical protein
LEVYKRVNGKYELQSGNLVWMPEIGLGIGCETIEHGGWNREWVYWYSEQGDRYLTSRELRWQEQQKRIQAEWTASQEREQRRKAEQQRRKAEQQQREAEQLAAYEQEQRREAEQLAAYEQEQRLMAERQQREAEQRLAELEARMKALGLDP